MTKRSLCFFLFVLFVVPTQQYRILCLFPFQGKSHFVMFEPLCKELAKRGHKVDMISHYPQSKPIANFTDIVNLSGTIPSVVGRYTIDDILAIEDQLIYEIASEFGTKICELMGHERMQNFIKSQAADPPYDVIITEYFGPVCYMAFGHLLKAPLIAMASTLEYNTLGEIIGNPTSLSYFPHSFSRKAVIETFWDRLTNTVTNAIISRQLFYYTNSQTDIIRRYLSPDMPHVRELEKDVALVLTNSYYTFHGVRAFVPALVEVGGLHLENHDSKLTPELEKWLDSAQDGVVYFSFGSLTRLESIPTETLLDLYASFAKIAPIKVLMKVIEKEKLPPGLPQNVVTYPWLPQISLLGHKNVRAFISHGGLMGTFEALYHGVPVIGVPLFADQLRNVNILVHKRMGVALKYEELNEKSMDAALNAILKDPTYREAAKKQSALFKDRPMSAMDTAVYWVEYVARNGPKVLRSPAMDMPWWQRSLLDVYAFLLVLFAVALCAIVALAKFLCKCSGSPAGGKARKGVGKRKDD